MLRKKYRKLDEYIISSEPLSCLLSTAILQQAAIILKRMRRRVMKTYLTSITFYSTKHIAETWKQLSKGNSNVGKEMQDL